MKTLKSFFDKAKRSSTRVETSIANTGTCGVVGGGYLTYLLSNFQAISSAPLPALVAGISVPTFLTVGAIYKGAKEEYKNVQDKKREKAQLSEISDEFYKMHGVGTRHGDFEAGWKTVKEEIENAKANAVLEGGKRGLAQLAKDGKIGDFAINPDYTPNPNL